MMDFSFLTSWWFIVLLVLLGTTAGYRIVRRIPLVKAIPRNFYFYGGVILAIMMLVPSLMFFGGTGSLAAGGADVVQLQTTTAYLFSGNVTAVADSGSDSTKGSVFYINETQVAGNGYIDTGVWQVRRAGSLPADSCLVQVIKPPRFDISDTTYHLVDEVSASDTTMKAYVHTGSSTGDASNSDPKETNYLAFDEGVANGFVAVNITIDETAWDELTQYDSKFINVDVCGYAYSFELVKADSQF